MTVEVALEIVNALGFIIFLGMLALAVVSMVMRVMLYSRIGRRASIILRRDLALLSSLLFVFGSLALIRFFNIELLLEVGWPRFFYVVATDIVALSALGYWVWAEYFVIGKPDKEDS